VIRRTEQSVRLVLNGRVHGSPVDNRRISCPSDARSPSTISSGEDPDATVSWQVGTTVAALSERVEALPVDDATQEALEALRNGAE